ncbi:MAG: hypothetical protein INR71_15130, partial [Terriglobus roseus]|nr:hypothetical protein [Terriglobus roseus]
MRASSLRPLCFLVTLLPLAATAQTSVPLGAPPPQLSPQAAYQDAMHPLQITRNNIANWSDTEIAAMNVAIAKAKAGCLARNPADYDAAALIDLARLCSLGQQWPSVVLAASRYIENDVAEPKPLLPDAYVAKTEALLRMKAEPTALASALTMLSTVPYTPDIGDCVDEAIGYMRFVHNADALTLAMKRQPLLLRALETTGAPAAAQPTTGAPPQPAVAPASSSLTAEALYRQGLLLPALQQLAAEPVAAKGSVSALDAALPLSLNSDDTLRIAQDRRRYALLGRPLPRLHPLASLSMPYDRPPALPVRGAITAMLLFPDWCAQCVRM